MNKKLRQLHKHIEQRGNHLVKKVTPQLCRYWWKVCNDAVFDGILNDPVLIVRPMRDYGQCGVDQAIEIDGWMVWDRDRLTIEIASNKPLTRKLFLAILIHEMIHQWEYQLGPGRNHVGHAGHGAPFKRWAKKASKRSGLNITREFSEKEYVTDGQRELHKRRHKSSKRSRTR